MGMDNGGKCWRIVGESSENSGERSENHWTIIGQSFAVELVRISPFYGLVDISDISRLYYCIFLFFSSCLILVQPSFSV